MLGRRRILVAEDEVIIASELAAAVVEAGGQVVGPIASVREGLALLGREVVDAAILDVRLLDRDVAPIAEVLLRQGLAVVFHSASPVPSEITDRYSDVVLCPKPMPSDYVVSRLAILMAADGDE